MLREVVKKIALPCRDNGYEFIDHRRLNAIAGCLGEKWKMFWLAAKKPFAKEWAYCPDIKDFRM